MTAKVTASGAFGGIGDNPAPGHSHGFTRQMLRAQADDMVVDHDTVIHRILHSLGKESHGGTTAANAHDAFFNTIDDRCHTGFKLQHDLFVDL